MTIEITEYTLPTYWATYLFYGDHSGLADGEQEQIDKWLKQEGNPNIVDIDEESWFAHRNDATTMGGDVTTYYGYGG